MKALLFITGRGIGGDAVVGLNIIKALEKQGIECEIALDSKAPGILYEKNGYSWHKVSIPQAGGHAANKITAMKAGFKTITASIKATNLIRKVNPDIIVSVIGGGAVIGSISAKLSRKKCVSIIDTPLDTKVCSKLNKCIVLPENQIFKSENLPNNLIKSYFPIKDNISTGSYEKGINKINKHIQEVKEKYPNKDFPVYDENKKTILFSSGSSLFEGTVTALENFTKNYGDEYNILLVGDPLKKEYLEHVDDSKVINLGYINWINDCYAISDLAILTDDGNMIQEALVCELPIIALTRVKYGRSHNMASIFPNAVIESEIEDANENIMKVIENIDNIKNDVNIYKKEIMEANKKIADIIIKEGEL